MDRANRAITWGAIGTLVTVTICILLPFALVNPEHGKFAGAVLISGLLAFAYLAGMVGLAVVGGGTFLNLVRRRENVALETSQNLKYFRFGACFSAAVFLLLAAPFVVYAF